MTRIRGEQVCLKCRFFDANKENRKDGLCKRRAPQPVVTLYALLKAAPMPLPHWPTVLNSEWCGEFEARP